MEKNEKNISAKLDSFKDKRLNNYDAEKLKKYADSLIEKINKIIDFKIRNITDGNEIDEYNKIVGDEENWNIVKNEDLPMGSHWVYKGTERKQKLDKLHSAVGTLSNQKKYLEKEIKYYQKHPTWSSYYVNKYTWMPVKSHWGGIEHPFGATNYSKAKVKNLKKQLKDVESAHSSYSSELTKTINSSDYVSVYEPLKYTKDEQLQSLTFLWASLMKIKIECEKKIEELKNKIEQDDVESKIEILNIECSMISGLWDTVDRMYNFFEISRRLREEIIEDEIKNIDKDDDADYRKENLEFLKEMENYK